MVVLMRAGLSLDVADLKRVGRPAIIGSVIAAVSPVFTALISLASTGTISVLLLELQNRLEEIIPISGLLAIMSLGIVMKQKHSILAERLSSKYNKLWVAAEVFLFVLVKKYFEAVYGLPVSLIGESLKVALIRPEALVFIFAFYFNTPCENGESISS